MDRSKKEMKKYLEIRFKIYNSLLLMSHTIYYLCEWEKGTTQTESTTNIQHTKTHLIMMNENSHEIIR